MLLLARPTDANVVKYFIRIGEIFSANDDEESRGDKLAIICERLNMTEEQLVRLQKANGTKTARSIVRAYYPPHVRLKLSPDNIEVNVRQAVHGSISICLMNIQQNGLAVSRLCSFTSCNGEFVRWKNQREH